ncbi:PREDICTED: transposase [Prunus dulcis]|uniref:PREDICTED: transposase n=1 Tax=Prunus dulcis TaxID=3755 RepID=A0A5E4FXN6_PRUDU|nr:PREDICTED: transposase [Prunus dulcis]
MASNLVKTWKMIGKYLHPKKRGKRFYLSAAPHTLSKKEKETFCWRLANLKLPDGYGSNIGNCISLEDSKIFGLKSHDYHMLMQQLLLVALRGLLPKGPRTAIFQLCAFFNELCQRVVDRNKLEKLEEDIVHTLCMLERFFPPSFFDVMLHLTIHLGQEACLCGPVQYHWMYPFERYMKVLKGYVMNRARLEGKYIKQAADIGSRNARNEEFENGLLLEGRPISQGKRIILTNEMLQVAHRQVLFSMAEMSHI